MYRLQVKTIARWRCTGSATRAARNTSAWREKKKSPHPVRDCAGRRSGADVVRVRAAAAGDRRVPAGRLAARQAGPVRQGVTQPIEVPANAEIVIEGYVDPNEHRMEGPFGDHTGFYTPPTCSRSSTSRPSRTSAAPIYPTTVVGQPPMEDYWMGKATERLFLPLIQLFLGEIVDVNMPAEGVFHNLVIVSLKQALSRPRAKDHVWAVGPGADDAGESDRGGR